MLCNVMATLTRVAALRTLSRKRKRDRYSFSPVLLQLAFFSLSRVRERVGLRGLA